MKRPSGKPLALTRVSKAVRLPRHVLSPRLHRMLKAIDGVHTAANLKTVAVVMNPFVTGGVFDAHTGTGPYTIYLNPTGGHPELSLAHEIGHFLEWQAILKAAVGQRRFTDYLLFAQWLQAVRASRNVSRLLDLRNGSAKESLGYRSAHYLLDDQELWARSYSQYLAVNTSITLLTEQIAAENKIITGNIQLKPYWDETDFLSIKAALDTLLQTLSWSR